MLVSEQEKLKSQMKAWCEQHGADRSALLPVLQEVQKTYTHVPDFAMQYIADLLGIHPVEVYGVVSFYSFLSRDPQGKFVIRLCQSITCEMAGKAEVARQLENDLGIRFGETTADGMFMLEYANCLGMCDQAPAMLVNDRVYTQVTPAKVHDIIE